MTTRGRRRRVAGGRRASRNTNWVDSTVNLETANGTQDTRSLLSGLGAEDVPGLTLVRTIIHLAFAPLAPGVASGAMRLDWGIGLVQGEALAAGIVADPFAETDFPLRGWIVRDFAPVVDSIDSYDHPYVEINMDLKSQRKLHTQDSEVVLILEANDLSGTFFTVQTVGWIRMLYKQP